LHACLPCHPPIIPPTQALCDQLRAYLSTSPSTPDAASTAVITGLMRDLVGVCESCTTRRTYNAFFSWLHPDVLSMLPQVLFSRVFYFPGAARDALAVFDFMGRPAACFNRARHPEAAVRVIAQQEPKDPGTVPASAGVFRVCSRPTCFFLQFDVSSPSGILLFKEVAWCVIQSDVCIWLPQATKSFLLASVACARMRSSSRPTRCPRTARTHGRSDLKA
jgi:hypothetical protein